MTNDRKYEIKKFLNHNRKKCLYDFALLAGWVIWADWAAHADDDMYSIT